MNALITNLANERSREMRSFAAKRRLAIRSRRTRPESVSAADQAALIDVSVRRLDEQDREALAHLAGLDSSEPPSGQTLGAELDGRLVAAISLSTGVVIADPFTRTDAIRELLKLRASRLQATSAHQLSRRGRRQLRAATHPRRS